MLPKINYSESFARSDNPVFVFSSLLTQHQFGLENFSIGPLNRPDFLNNFQSQVTVDQPLYDAGQTRNAVKSAELAQKMTVEEQRLVQMNVISGAARAYYGAVLAAESLKAAEQAVRSAEADLKRAEDVRAAGLSTDVDVLSIRVHLAAVTEQRIDRAADVDIAKAALNDALGLPLDTELELADVGTSPTDHLTREQYLAAALNHNPELQAAKETLSKARSGLMAARYEYIPNVGAFARETYQSGVPFLTHNFGTFGLQMTWNLVDWGKRKGVVGEREAQLTEAEENLRRITDRITVDVEKAYRKLERTQMMVDVAQEALALRREGDRISGDQLKAGLTSNAKNAEAVAATRSAEVDELQARLSLELAFAEIARITGSAGQ